jgi:hypothetical protein
VLTSDYGVVDVPEGIRHRRAVLRGLARNPAAPAWVLLRLMADRSLAKEVALHHPQPPAEIVDHLLTDGDADTLSCLGVGWPLPAQVREQMAGHPSVRVRARALRVDAPVDLVCRLADDPSPEIRAAVAADRRLPTELRTVLSRDHEVQVRAAVAQFWFDPPADVQRALLTDPEAAVRAQAVSVWHQPPPPDLVEALLADPATRAKAVRYAHITPELIADDDVRVRTSVAHHPDLDTATAIALSGDPQPEVWYALIFNPATPEPLRNKLLDRTGREDQSGFFHSYYLHNAWKDRASTGWLWSAPLPVRLTYVDSPHYFFRRAVASTDLPPDAVARLLRDPDRAYDATSRAATTSPRPNSSASSPRSAKTRPCYPDWSTCRTFRHPRTNSSPPRPNPGYARCAATHPACRPLWSPRSPATKRTRCGRPPPRTPTCHRSSSPHY